MTSTPYDGPLAEEELSDIMPPLSSSAAESALSDGWLTLRKRKWVILGAGLAGLVYGYYTAKTQPRLYDAAGSIEIRTGAANEFKLTGVSTNSDNVSRLPTQVAVLKSDRLLLAVAQDLNLANNPQFTGPSERIRTLNDAGVRQNVLSHMQGIVSITTLPKTDIVRINCSTLDAQLSAEIVNTLVREYIQYSFQSRADANKRVTDFFSHQLDDLKQQVESAQGQMIDLQRQLGVLGFDPTLNQVTANLGDLNRAVDAAQVARIEAESKYHVAAGSTRGGAGTSPLTSATVVSIRNQLDTARATLAQLSANLGPNHPQVLAARQQIAELTQELQEAQNRVVLEAKEAYFAAQVNEDQTQAALNAEKDKAFQLRDLLVEYTLKQREFDADRQLYEALSAKLRTAGVEAGLESTEIDILDVAVPPIAPSLRKTSTILIIDGVAMLILGIIVAFVLDSLDTGLSTVGEVEAVSGLPSLALIPRTKRSTADAPHLSVTQQNVVVLSSPRSPAAEAFRSLRTSLLLSVAGGEPQTVLLTSATPAEGKTTVSMNLACVLAQRDVRTLLIDADLRRPTIHHRFGLNGRVGLTSVLTGSVSLQDAVQQVSELPSLDVLVSGPVPPFPTELLGSDAMRQLLERCRGIYTHIVMDSPPLLSVTDSIVLARDADAVVLIVRQGKSRKQALRRARDLLVRSGARITGVALNGVDLNSPEYSTYYGYYGYTGYASEGVDSAGWDAKPGTEPDRRPRS